ncbi:MAG: 23S rRNA (uracil(1939)-C(5))-methyltransferase RlmD [Lachnospiraceae bacterium]|nr:23S rRNA (uracil(1939)-C(5))-methyltransferase RlmD [Lachnospiraceae bacterium]
MKKDDILTVKIEDFSSEGLGVGYPVRESSVEDGACPRAKSSAEGEGPGPVLFVKDTIIGDVAEVKVMKMKKTYGYARLLRVLTPSPDRITAPCPVARPCGGCQIQEMKYEAQLRFKEQKVRGNLQRIGGFANPPMEPIIGMESHAIEDCAPHNGRGAVLDSLCESEHCLRPASKYDAGHMMESPFRYRNKAQYPIGRDKNGSLIAGFYAGRTHTVIDCRDCLLGAKVNKTILDTILNHMETCRIEPYDEATGKGLVRHVMIRVGKDLLNDGIEPAQSTEVPGSADTAYTTELALDETNSVTTTEPVHGEVGSAVSIEPAHGKADAPSGQIMVCIVINGTSLPKSDRLVQALRAIPGMASITLNINREHTNVIMGRQVKLLWGKEYIEDQIGGIRFRISPLSFYQVNPRQTEKLYAKALEYAGLTGQETVWDLYCGIGTISLFLAQKARTVYGVEIVPDAIRDARRNAELNGITNAEFFVGKAEEVLPEKYEREGIHADVIVVDPPRKGCDMSVLDTMLKIAPKRIVYVSCDSATLARDLKYLCANGYELRKVCPTEMFANSVHIECVALISRGMEQ